MKEYITKEKGYRLLAYLIDVAILLVICYFVLPLLHLGSLQDIMRQISVVHAEVDPVALQRETLVLMPMIEQTTIGFAVLSCVYDIVFLFCFSTTPGKALFHLKIDYEKTGTFNRFWMTCLRSAIKGLITAFLGSILLVLSGFSVIASKEQISLQDRIAKTKIQCIA